MRPEFILLSRLSIECPCCDHAPCHPQPQGDPQGVTMPTKDRRPLAGRSSGRSLGRRHAQRRWAMLLPAAAGILLMAMDARPLAAETRAAETLASETPSVFV